MRRAHAAWAARPTYQGKAAVGCARPGWRSKSVSGFRRRRSTAAGCRPSSGRGNPRAAVPAGAPYRRVRDRVSRPKRGCFTLLFVLTRRLFDSSHSFTGRKQVNGIPDVPMYLVQQFERDVVDPVGVDNDPLELKRGCSAVASAC